MPTAVKGVIRHAKDGLLAAALHVARDQGLRQLSFGRVATQAGTNDRTVVYYFPNKEVLVTEVLLAMSRELETRLSAVGDERLEDHRHLLEVAWPVLAHPDADAVFALFFEASGLAAARVAPYQAIVPALVSAWLDWAEARLGGTPTTRRSEAEAAVALLDGLLLFRQTMGPDAADRAARRLAGRQWRYPDVVLARASGRRLATTHEVRFTLHVVEGSTPQRLVVTTARPVGPGEAGPTVGSGETSSRFD